MPVAIKGKAKEKRKMPMGNRWPKGVSGNPSGRPASEISITAIIKRMGEEVPNGEKQTRADLLAQLIWEQALEGNATAQERILDRIDGKATENLNINGAAIQVNLITVMPTVFAILRRHPKALEEVQQAVTAGIGGNGQHALETVEVVS